MHSSLITPLALLAGSAALFFGYVNPSYEKIIALRAEAGHIRETLASARDIQDTRDALLSKYNNFPAEDITRLSRMLPDHVDNVRLILEIESIASRYGMVMSEVQIKDQSAPSNASASFDSAGTPQLRGTTDTLGTTNLSFTVAAPYGTFLQFLRDVEKSLRVVDVTSLHFSPAEEAKAVDFYDFNVSLQTYWLKAS